MVSVPVTVARTRHVEGGFEGGMEFAKGTVKVTYELSTQVTGTDQIVISGAERNEYDDDTMGEEVGDPDRCNVAEWRLFENSTTRSGLPSSFQTAVLLERRNGDKARFTATFTIRAEMDDVTDALVAFKRFFGLVPRDDPIIFDPSIDERGRLSGFKDKLDTVSLMDECKFVMFKGELGTSGQEAGQVSEQGGK